VNIFYTNPITLFYIPINKVENNDGLLLKIETKTLIWLLGWVLGLITMVLKKIKDLVFDIQLWFSIF
jgi:hypothetical protein